MTRILTEKQREARNQYAKIYQMERRRRLGIKPRQPSTIQDKQQRKREWKKRYRLAHMDLHRRDDLKSFRKKRADLMAKIITIFGSKCQRCGASRTLSLHHKYYAADSVMPGPHESGAHLLARKKEAIEHPERFMYLCNSCHRKIEHRKRSSIVLANGQTPLRNTLELTRGIGNGEYHDNTKGSLIEVRCS